MIHASPRARRRADTRARIVDAAVRIHAEEGFDALTIQRLAGELGYANGALYRYFPSKDAIVVAAQQRALGAIVAELRAVAARFDAHTDLEAGPLALLQLLAVSRLYDTLVAQRPAELRLLSQAIADPRELLPTETAREVVPHLAVLIEHLGGFLASAAVATSLRPGDASRRATTFAAALFGMLALAKLDRPGLRALDVRDAARELCRTLLAGWGADPAHLAQLESRLP